MSDYDMMVWHWLPEEKRWESVKWGVWSKFRGILEPGVGMPGIDSGIHYFVVCPQDEGHVVNIIPHKYLLEPNGRIGRDNFGGLTKEERADYSRIMIAMKHTPEDGARLAAIHEKLGRGYELPEESVEPLKQALGKPALKGGLAEKFFQDYRT